VEEDLEFLQKLGIIYPVQFANWAAPIVPVLKLISHMPTNRWSWMRTPESLLLLTHFQYSQPPFGITWETIPGVYVYIDDILVTRSSE